MALVFVVVMGVFGVAVLSQTASAPSVQQTYASVRSTDLGADNATEAVIQQLRGNANAGLDDTTIGSVCDNQAAATTMGTYTASNGTKLTVLCKPNAQSGWLRNGQGGVPLTPVVAFGGVYGQGNYLNETSGAKSPQANLSFCDDWETAGSNSCEAGLYLGHGIADSDTGGFQVGETDITQANSTLVRSNGSIVINRSGGGGASRSLSVAGNVWARRGCGGFTSGTFTSGTNIALNLNNASGSLNCPTIPAPWNLVTDLNNIGVNQINGDGTSSQRNGSAGYTPCTLHPVGDTCYTNFYQDPKFASELSSGVSTNSDLPDLTYDKVKQQLTGGLTAYRVNPALLTSTLCQNGYAVMPATQLKDVNNAAITDSLGNPVYVAWYDNAAALNTLMASCADTFFYFRPGVYYFDFTDAAGTATRWTSPAGCFPITCANHIPSEILGGMATFGSDASTGAVWNPCTDDLKIPTASIAWAKIQACQQPEKVMLSQTNTNSGAWTNPLGGTVMGDSDTNGKANIASDALYNGNGTQTDTLVMDSLQTPIPQNVGVNIASVTSVKFEVAYNLSGDASQYKNQANDSSADGGAEVDISIAGGTGTGHCYLHLAAGSHMQTTDAVPASATGSGEVFDLTNGCTRANLGSAYISSTNGFPTTAGGWAIHPDWVNQLKATFKVSAAKAVDRAHSVGVQVDGMQFNVSWLGRPAPQYPNGCDSSMSGVQLVFGNMSRIYWGGGNDGFSEFCASKQGVFPGVDQNASGASYGIGLYGVSEATAPSPMLVDSDPSDASAVTIPLTYDVVHSSGWPLPANPIAHSGDPSNVNQAGDNKYASTTWIGTNSVTAAYTLPTNLVCAQGSLTLPAGCLIPYGSEITNVQFTMTHREGDTTGAGPDGSNVASINVAVTPPSTNSATGSNGYAAKNNWSTTSTSDVPPTINLNDTNAHTGCSSFCTWSWGLGQDQPRESPLATAGCNPGPAPSFAPTAATCDWTFQRTLTDDIASPEAVQGASLSVTVSPKNVTGHTHEFDLDQIGLRVVYRPAGALRPLRGCLTTRTPWRPQDLMTDASGYNLAPSALDVDWGANAQDSATATTPYEPDSAFTDGSNSASTFGNGSNDGKTIDCSLLDISNTNGSNFKFHESGLIYAPSAALYLAGHNNDASWTNTGLWARQITAWRWNDNTGVIATCAVGCTFPQRNNRSVTLTVVNGSGQTVLTEGVKFDDEYFQTLGKRVYIASYQRAS